MNMITSDFDSSMRHWTQTKDQQDEVLAVYRKEIAEMPAYYKQRRYIERDIKMGERWLRVCTAALGRMSETGKPVSMLTLLAAEEELGLV